MEKHDYPLMLQVGEVAEILDISKRRAYEIMEIEGFPLVRIGNRKRTPRDKFFEWLEGGVTIEAEKVGGESNGRVQRRNRNPKNAS